MVKCRAELWRTDDDDWARGAAGDAVASNEPRPAVFEATQHVGAESRHHAESFAAYRESRSGARLYAEMGVRDALPFALFCVDIALTPTTVHDLRNSALPPQDQSWEAYVADKVNQAAWGANGFEWVFFTAGWFFPGERADQAVLLVDEPRVVRKRRPAS